MVCLVKVERNVIALSTPTLLGPPTKMGLKRSTTNLKKNSTYRESPPIMSLQLFSKFFDRILINITQQENMCCTLPLRNSSRWYLIDTTILLVLCHTQMWHLTEDEPCHNQTTGPITKRTKPMSIKKINPREVCDIQLTSRPNSYLPGLSILIFNLCPLNPFLACKHRLVK